MGPHPDFAESDLPRHATLLDFRLTPLSGAEVDEDFAAIKRSQAVLKGLFGDDSWPTDITHTANLTDLHWHDREFTARRSFSWIIRDEAMAYIGCAYLLPTIGERGTGEIVTWLCDMPERVERLAAFNAAFEAWLAPYLPPGYAVSWTSNDAAFA
jgi:hypothetical protein